MTPEQELMAYALKLARREKVEAPVIVPLWHWATPDWKLIPSVRLEAPKKPEIEFINDHP